MDDSKHGASPHSGRANALASERSPYLLQHAHNPVDWRPWGREAFDEARRRDVPIFLSIGYSTCYWCHVMERESFENESIARLMNERFVCIKVDREERPDVDDIYMAATLIMTGHGGWPMSCFLEPTSLKPFLCGTYFPPEPRYNRPGFPQILEGISAAWRDRRAEVLQQAEALAEDVRTQMHDRAKVVPLSIDHVSRAAQSLLSMLDRVNGGFGSSPKFPQPVLLEFLLDVRDRAGDEATREAIDHACRLTLDRMSMGGLFDHIGGGFHRYCVDATWTVPHFEKMLYDNAPLAALYARAAATYRDSWYARIAERTLTYLSREMTRGEGFWSAQDAEVAGREGANYLWAPDEVRAVLPSADAEFAIRVYGLDHPANFRDPHHPEISSWVPRLADRPEVIARGMNLEAADFDRRLAEVNLRLLETRRLRAQPRLDDKPIASWNGMAIAAFARASRLLRSASDESSSRIDSSMHATWLAEARRAMAFVLKNLRDDRGELLRVPAFNGRSIRAFFEDYTQIIAALLELHHAGVKRIDDQQESVLDLACDLVARAERLFADDQGGYFDTPGETPDLFVRPRSTHDGALPSGLSVMILNLIDLHTLAGDASMFHRAMACLDSLSATIDAAPAGVVNAVRGVLRLATSNDPAIAARFVPRPDAAPSREHAEDFTPVKIYADAERVRVGRDVPGLVRLVVRIAPGYHVNAADLGPIGNTPAGRSLVPFRVQIMNGRGVTAYAEYPEGAPLGEQGELRVYEKEHEFRVVLEREGEWSGRPLVAVTYQACTNTECLQPRTVELDIAIDRAE